jgi:pimeloyl-ACP methyl ester carboxylesterase
MGHTVMQVAGCGPPVVLIHGFGASIGHFRKNIPALAEHYKVRPASQFNHK